MLDADRTKGFTHLSKRCFPLSQAPQINATYFHFKGEKREVKVMERVLTNEIKCRKVT